MNMKLEFGLSLLLAFTFLLPSIRADDFYASSFETRDVIVDLVADYGASGLGVDDDSLKLQTAIDDVYSQGGGVVNIPLGMYQLVGVHLKSNVQLEIENDTVIKPFIAAGEDRSISIFSLGKEQLPVENISIEGIGGRFSIVIDPFEPGVRAFALGNVTNFYVGDVDIFDSLTKFSSFAMGPGLKNMADFGIPTQGTVANASSFNAHYGYGLVQTQSANTVNFRQLYSLGGATLRVETGWARMNDWQIPGTGAFNIIGNDISCEDGNAAVMLSPHSMFNGVVQIDGVESIGCGFAVRVANGFISSKQTNPDLELGTFDEGTYVKNITATYGENAQLKGKHFKYVPDELKHLIQDESTSEDGESVRGPAIAAVVYTPNYPTDMCEITDIGFLYNPPVVPEGFHMHNVIGDGTDSRSSLNEVSMKFTGLMTSLPDAFTMTKRETAELVNVSVVADTDSGMTTFELLFSGDLTLNSGSLVDGNYILNVDSTKVLSSESEALEADLVFGDQQSHNLFRFYGDDNGDRTANVFDLLSFRSSYETSVGDEMYNANFEYDGNDTINIFELLQFRRNYLKTLPWGSMKSGRRSITSPSVSRRK